MRSNHCILKVFLAPRLCWIRNGLNQHMKKVRYGICYYIINKNKISKQISEQWIVRTDPDNFLCTSLCPDLSWNLAPKEIPVKLPKLLFTLVGKISDKGLVITLSQFFNLFMGFCSNFRKLEARLIRFDWSLFVRLHEF